MLDGEEGPKKQLLADLLFSLNEEFLLKILESALLEKNKLEHLSYRQIEDLFGFRRGQVERWTTSSKTKLRHLLVHIPCAYVEYAKGIRINKEAFQSLLPKKAPKRTEDND